MTAPECPDCPKVTDEHGVNPASIEEQLRYELEFSERSFLSGPRSRMSDLATLFKVSWDFIRAFRVLHFVGPCVTIFGSARTPDGTTYYEWARKMGARMAKMGFTVMTGGGPEGQTETMVFYVWRQAFRSFNLGYAAALSVVISIALLLVSLIQVRFINEKD